MEVGKERERECTNWAELDPAMAEGPMLIDTAILVVFGIVCEGRENLEKKTLLLKHHGNRGHI